MRCYRHIKWDFCVISTFLFDADTESFLDDMKKFFDKNRLQHKELCFIVNDWQKENGVLDALSKYDIEYTLVAEEDNKNSDARIYLYRGVCNNPNYVEESYDYTNSTYVGIHTINMECCGCECVDDEIPEPENTFMLGIMTTAKMMREAEKYMTHVVGNLYVLATERYEFEDEEDDF